jgi:hypothetical protein
MHLIHCCNRLRPQIINLASVAPDGTKRNPGWSTQRKIPHSATFHAGYARWRWRRRDGKGRLYERRLARSPGATHEEGGTGNLTLTGCQRHSSFISNGLFNATLRINSLMLIHIGRTHHTLAHHIK